MNDDLRPLMEAGTAVIADVFDSMGRLPLVLDSSIHPVGGKGERFAGPAYTVEGRAHTWKGSGDREKLSAIDNMPEGIVALWAGNDIRGVCCFGDLLATAMKARGVLGVVVDGGVRDTAFIGELGLPVLARYATPAQAIGRWKVTACQEAVRVRGALEDWVTVHPGDTIVSDEDGVIIVPREVLAEVKRRVAEWAETDNQAREDIARGLPLIGALERYGHL